MTSRDFKRLVKNNSLGSKRGASLVDILQVADQHSFMTSLVELGDWPQVWEVAEIEALPEERKMVLVLNAFHLEVSSGGISQFVAAPVVGAFYSQVVGWCGLLGARNTENTLRCFAHLAPGMLVPAAEAPRHRLLEIVRSQKIKREVRQLDQQCRESLGEFVETLRSYVKQNEPRFAASLRRR